MVTDELKLDMQLSQLFTPSKKFEESYSVRQIIPEDFDWSLANVPLLKDLTIDYIAKNFGRKMFNF